MNVSVQRCWCILCAVAAVGVAVAADPIAPASSDDLTLWYRQPATRWMSALPIGNGRLGAMVYGGIDEALFALNESTCWSGAADDNTDNPRGATLLGPLQQTMLQGGKARDLFRAFCGQRGTYGTHRPFANMRLRVDHPDEAVQHYRRQLDLDTAIARTTYRIDDIQYGREVFASYPEQVLVMRLTTEAEGRVSFTVTLDANKTRGRGAMAAKGDDLVYDGRAYQGVQLHARLRAIPDGGDVRADAEGLHVRGARAVTLLVALGTDYADNAMRRTCREQITHAAAMPYECLRQRHVDDHQRLFRRCGFELHAPHRTGRPTDERLQAYIAGQPDPRLAMLMFQYGRYLLIAGSRPGMPLPMNLQGLWNDNQACNIGWTCDYHLDINTQMNYWPANVTNLATCHAPLFAWLSEKLVPSGRRTARVQYGCDGWVAHTFSNAWGWSSVLPATNWGPFHGGGTWLASHLWTHFQFTGDRRFLAERAYPVLRDAAAFYLDYLIEHPEHGWWVTAPSCSPEHGGLAVMPTCDRVLIHDLLSHCIDASEMLNVDADLRQRWREVRQKLPPLQISRHGQLQEWLDDRTDGRTNHRHTSHLIALYPSAQITMEQTPRLAAAARLSLQRRLAHPNWQDTGWSRAWAICYWARLKDGREAHRSVQAQLRKMTDRNLFVFHPPLAGADDNIFELDGNTGLTAGIAEMLVQSHRRWSASVGIGEDKAGHPLGPFVIELLPALPAAWARGSVRGLCARGGFVVDIDWAAGQMTRAVIHSSLGGPCVIQSTSPIRVEHDGRDGACTAMGDEHYRIDTRAGERSTIHPMRR